jgi:phage N-6-adenine-methyltransferase
VNNALFFNNAGDERGTPQDFFDKVNARYGFTVDVAAGPLNHKCELWFGEGGLAFDALEVEWAPETCWMNPPYSVCGAFVRKAWEEAQKGATVVGLLPVRTDAAWWHTFIYDSSICQFRPGVFVDFLRGRLSFELFVTDEQRAIVKAEVKDIFEDEDLSSKERETRLKKVIEATGLPKMAIEGIWEDKPNEDLLGNAPFPSCLVEWRKP